MMLYTEEEIVKTLRKNREEGARMLVEQYQKLLWSVCAKRLQNVEDIKDCIHDTYAEFFLHLDKYDESMGSLKNYLCVIADRKAIDRYRRTVREEAFLHSQSEKMEFSQIDEREIERLEAALDQLPKVDQQILKMKYYEEMSYQEISERLGLKYENVKKRSQRSKKRLLYILLLGILLGLLIACAVAVYKKYYYSDMLGVIWDEGTAYELADMEQYIEYEDFRLQFCEGFFQENKIVLKIKVTWIGEDGISNHEIRRSFEDIMTNSMYVKTINESRCHDLIIYLRPWSDDLTFDIMLWSEERDVDILFQKNDSIVFIIGRDTGIEKEIFFTPMDSSEVTMLNDIAILPKENLLTLGAVTQVDDITNMYLSGTRNEEYQVSPLLVNSIYGIGEKQAERVTLIDKMGNVYEHLRIENSVSENGMDFSIRFQDVPVGEYTLCIPYVCFVKEDISERVVINLPTGEESYVECDTTILFPNGVGFQIVGIQREERQGIQVDVDIVDGQEIMTPVQVEEWVYSFDCVPIGQEEELKFYSALLQVIGLEELGISGGIGNDGRPTVRISKEHEITSLEIQFVNPVYVWEQELEWNVTVK